jgi:hypothetical protein
MQVTSFIDTVTAARPGGVAAPSPSNGARRLVASVGMCPGPILAYHIPRAPTGIAPERSIFRAHRSDYPQAAIFHDSPVETSWSGSVDVIPIA